MASLYVGADQTELIKLLRDCLIREPNLELHVLIDCLRGTRGGKNSARLLAPLLGEFGSRVRVNMYHTPSMGPILKRLLPERFNEGLGLQHMKIYAFDDDVILTGANLNADYFDNRQDRYMVFEDTPVSEYYHELIQTVSSFSYTLIENGSLDTITSFPDPVYRSGAFKASSRDVMQTFLQKWMKRTGPTKDTLVCPVVQMGQIGIRQDEAMATAILKILGHSQQDFWRVFITSGYMNFTPKYRNLIFESNSADYDVLTASPEANGWFTSKGISSHIPAAYTYLEKQFFEEIQRKGKESKITIDEWSKPGWTYHCKGLWAYLNEQDKPSVTVIGSTNFGLRSMNRDVEAQALVVTQNEQLQRQLDDEVEFLRATSERVTAETFKRPERQLTTFVKAATPILRDYF